MNAETEKRKLKFFLGTLVGLALLINLQFLRLPTIERPVQSQSYSQPPQQHYVASTPEPVVQKVTEDPEVARRKAAEAAARARENYLARYLNPGTYERKSGIKTIAISAVSENGRSSRGVNTFLANRLKGESVKILSSLFRPEFVSDGLFDRVSAGDNGILGSLELTKILDALVLARQQVRYTSDPSLENVITANMELQVFILPVGTSEESQSWTLIANGVGFKQNEARLMAEERLLKQLTNDSRLSLSQVLPDLQNQ